MTKPNFFILGAPKCATTSMAAWLAAHPAIFMPSVKEPHYFNTDEKRYINSLANYERLFEDATSQQTAIGEASVWYLYSNVAVANILAYQPSARFIVMVRNPADMAVALHEEMVFSGFETIADFEAAWHAQTERQQGKLGARFGDTRRLIYGEACSLGLQIERLLSQVLADRVLIVVQDDLRADSGRQYRRVLEFLGVADDGRSAFPVLNTAKQRRWPLLPRLSNLVVEVKRRLGIEAGFGIWRRLEAKNLKAHVRPPLSAAMRTELVRFFEDDIVRLERILGRSLDGWRV